MKKPTEKQRRLSAWGSILLLAGFLGQACQNPSSFSPAPQIPANSQQSEWAASKAAQVPACALPSAYQNPQALGVDNLAWEDGIYVSRDGLNLYASYLPMDSLSAVSAGATPLDYYKYERGSQIGQDFTNLLAPTYTVPWIHSDLAIAQRSSTGASFTAWTLSNLHDQYYNLGAAQGIPNSTDPTKYDYFFYTCDQPINGSTSSIPKIYMAKAVGVNPSAGFRITITGENDAYPEDNPHCENVGGTLVLFFESDASRPGGRGAQDIWYTTSNNNGTAWSAPANLTSVNTAGYDGQPHLYNDGSTWWLYCTQTNPADGKLAIYRYHLTDNTNPDTWTGQELVVSAGTAQGVGEPSLTASGDLYFVTVFKKTVNPTAYDLYDADAWVMKKK